MVVCLLLKDPLFRLLVDFLSVAWRFNHKCLAMSRRHIEIFIRFIPVDYNALRATWHPVETKVEKRKKKNDTDSVMITTFCLTKDDFFKILH